MFRIEGMDMMIDIFYRPNNLSVEDFENVWNRARTQEKLKSCDLNTDSEIFSRISNTDLCEAAIKNPKSIG